MSYTQEELRRWVFSRTKGHCFYCGRPLVYCNYGLIAEYGAWELNAFMPVAKEPRRENLVCACVMCETEKGRSLPWDFHSKFEHGDENPENYIAPVEGSSFLKSDYVVRKPDPFCAPPPVAEERDPAQ